MSCSVCVHTNIAGSVESWVQHSLTYAHNRHRIIAEGNPGNFFLPIDPNFDIEAALMELKVVALVVKENLAYSERDPLVAWSEAHAPEAAGVPNMRMSRLKATKLAVEVMGRYERERLVAFLNSHL
ncbi:hypothetical protein QAD02_018159 [Eretmocerus hayati]|uniref:Uncharacterized protein n=1 Tax=Eretmocerus hayati TaxID=131215 RepID=A0ACC2PFW4_9HYME|nr:hypothetical protein QAD02_018159 [Eretmocerus hayati]